MNYSPTALVRVAQCKNKTDLVHMNRLNYLEYNNPPFLSSEYCVDMLVINARNAMLELYSPCFFFYWFDMSFHTVFSVLRPSQETRFILTNCAVVVFVLQYTQMYVL